MKKTSIPILLLFTIIMTLWACKKDKDKDEEPRDYVNLTFNFTHKVGTETAEFNTIKYVNAIGNQYSVTTLNYFVSDITLHKSDGGTTRIDAEHYVNAKDNTTISFAPTDNISNGTYTHISFVFGLDSIKNVTGAYLNPPEANMEWPVPMGGGYHYMKLEGRIDSSGVIKNYQNHTGPLDGDPYYLNVTLPASAFTADEADLTVEIVMDINRWYDNPNTIDLNDVTMIMGNQTMQQLLMENGIDVFSIGSIQ